MTDVVGSIVFNERAGITAQEYKVVSRRHDGVERLCDRLDRLGVKPTERGAPNDITIWREDGRCYSLIDTLDILLSRLEPEAA